MPPLFPADEVIQLVFNELNDPGSLCLTSKRFYAMSQDPYLRAHYFLARYGATEAMYHALGRGRLLTERVLDVRLFLLSLVAKACFKPPPYMVRF